MNEADRTAVLHGAVAALDQVTPGDATVVVILQTGPDDQRLTDFATNADDEADLGAMLEELGIRIRSPAGRHLGPN